MIRTPAIPQQRIGYLDILRNRNFSLLWVAYIISLLGDALHEIAIMVLVLETTGNEALVGLVFLAAHVPSIALSLLAGVLADRWNRKALLVACDVLRGVSVLAIPLLAAVQIEWIFLILVVRAILTSLWTPTVMAVMPDIVSENELLMANSLWRGANNISRILGYAIGGVVVAAVGTSLSFYLDGASYLISALLILPIIVPPLRRAAQRFSLKAIIQDIAEGLAFLRTSRVVLAFSILFLLITLPVGMYGSLFPVFAIKTLDIGSEGFGTLEAVMAAGGVLGAYLAGKLGQGAKGKMIIMGILIEMACYAALAVMHNYWLILIILFISGIDSPLMLIPFGAIFQEHTPSELRGRVFTVRTTLFSGIMAASMGAGPWLSSVVGMRTLFGILAAGLLIVSMCAMLLRTVRETK